MDEIIEMARQAGLVFDTQKPEISVYPPALKAFAKLVEERTAAKEREACAQIADSYSVPMCESSADAIAEQIRART